MIILQRKEKVRLSNNGTLVIEAELEYIKGNRKPHFALTGELWYRSSEPALCGSIHKEILEAKPEYKIIADLHLSDDDGTPLYAVENGWYWLGKTEFGGRDNEILAKHLRVPQETAEQLSFNTKEDFIKFVDSQKPRWLAEAKEAIAFLKEEGKCTTNNEEKYYGNNS